MLSGIVLEYGEQSSIALVHLKEHLSVFEFTGRTVLECMYCSASDELERKVL